MYVSTQLDLLHAYVTRNDHQTEPDSIQIIGQPYKQESESDYFDSADPDTLYLLEPFRWIIQCICLYSSNEWPRRKQNIRVGIFWHCWPEYTRSFVGTVLIRVIRAFWTRVGVGSYPGFCVKMNMEEFPAFIWVVIVKLECRLVLWWMVQSIRVPIGVIWDFWTGSGSDCIPVFA